jgi:hypothetical protein
MNLRALMDWGIVYKEYKAERREFFTAEKDLDERQKLQENEANAKSNLLKGFKRSFFHNIRQYCRRKTFCRSNN